MLYQTISKRLYTSSNTNKRNCVRFEENITLVVHHDYRNLHFTAILVSGVCISVLLSILSNYTIF